MGLTALFPTAHSMNLELPEERALRRSGEPLLYQDFEAVMKQDQKRFRGSRLAPMPKDRGQVRRYMAIIVRDGGGEASWRVIKALGEEDALAQGHAFAREWGMRLDALNYIGPE